MDRVDDHPRDLYYLDAACKCSLNKFEVEVLGKTFPRSQCYCIVNVAGRKVSGTETHCCDDRRGHLGKEPRIMCQHNPLGPKVKDHLSSQVNFESSSQT